MQKDSLITNESTEESDATNKWKTSIFFHYKILAEGLRMRGIVYWY
jgi:hypothetical protein